MPRPNPPWAIPPVGINARTDQTYSPISLFDPQPSDKPSFLRLVEWWATWLLFEGLAVSSSSFPFDDLDPLFSHWCHPWSDCKDSLHSLQLRIWAPRFFGIGDEYQIRLNIPETCWLLNSTIFLAPRKHDWPCARTSCRKIPLSCLSLRAAKRKLLMFETINGILRTCDASWCIWPCTFSKHVTQYANPAIPYKI